MSNFKIAERVSMKKLTITLFFVCISTLVLASNNYFEPVQLSDYETVLCILKQRAVDHNVADCVAKNIANRKMSQDQVYQKLHKAGGYGKQEICIPQYAQAARAIVENARSL